MSYHSTCSLKVTDKSRRLKNQLAKYLVMIGGISALGALVLMFGYLAWVVAPLFFHASFEHHAVPVSIKSNVLGALAVDDYGRYAFTADKDGQLAFWVNRSDISNPVDTSKLAFKPERWIKSSSGDWFLALGQVGSAQAAILQPDFAYQSSAGQRNFSPHIRELRLSSTLRSTLTDAETAQLSFSVMDDKVMMLISDTNGRLSLFEQDRQHPEAVRSTVLRTNSCFDELLTTPDNHLFYARSGNELYVYVQAEHQLQLRETVTLVSGQRKSISQMVLLPGAYSLLTLDSSGQVTQWFDVLRQGQRHLTRIRDFQLGRDVQFLLPNSYSKGFSGFFANGQFENYYTTSEKQVLAVHAFTRAPELAAMSSNERHLVSFDDHALQFTDVDLGFAEITFSGLWKKIWYEGYPEPQYVWQSTSASNIFEPKFSLVPIAFGTLKAALFAMLFAVPVAVLAAIYTAYFMTPSMRRIVKPSIELMEALPTVIIGFLAGLWFAPIVEKHLVSVVLIFVLLPLSMMGFGAVWALCPRPWRRAIKKGWHAALLVPVIVMVIVCVLPLSVDIEGWLFGGDIRVFLADWGINFDQRNVIVVGLAMGFAVVPTIFTIAEDAIFSVPKHLTYGSLALGATQWQTLSRVVLQTASPGIFSAIMMGLGRAVGETMIVLMATGNTPIMNWNVLEGMRTLAATIAIELPESEAGGSHFRLLFLAALILFVFTFCVNSLAEWIRLRLREKYRAL